MPVFACRYNRRVFLAPFWNDTFSEGGDGTMYVTASHIQDTNWYTPGVPASIRTQLFSFPPVK